MTERGWFFDGTAKNDAEVAPYSAAEYARITNMLYSTDGAYVLYAGNRLEVTRQSSTAVNVATGAALIYGYHYTNSDNVTVTLDPNESDYPRWDRIVVEVNTNTGEHGVKAIKGVPEEKPDPPELGRCEPIYHLPLARVYLPSGYTDIDSRYVHDERHFINNVFHQNSFSLENDFPNHRFLGWGDSVDSRSPLGNGVQRYPLPGWTSTDGGSDIVAAPLFPSMTWGRCAKVTGGTVDAGWYTYLFQRGVATVRLLIRVDKGEAGILLLGGAGSITMPATTTEQEVIIRYTSDVPNLLSVFNITAGAEYTFGDIRVGQGYVVADENTYYDQYVLFEKPMLNNKFFSSFGGVEGVPLDNLSTGNQIIPLGDWGTDLDGDEVIPDINYVAPWQARIKSLILLWSANDSGSAASNTTQALLRTVRYEAQVWAVSRIQLQAEANDQRRHTQAFFPVYDNEFGHFAELEYTTSGTGTMDIQIAVVGVII